MKTRAELQEWMRSGCPVREAPAPVARCKRFWLQVQADSRGLEASLRIVAACRDCNREAPASEGLWDPRMKDVNNVKAGYTAEYFSLWMADHATRGGMPFAEAEVLYAMEPQRMSQWVIWLITRGRDGGWGGGRRPDGRGQAGGWPRDVWLDRELALSPMQPSGDAT